MLDTNTFQNTLETLRQFLSERWELMPLDEETYQFSYITAPGIPVICLAWINSQSAALFFRVVLEVPVAPAQRLAMAELLTRLNYPLPNGAFAMEYDTGEIRFKSGLFFSGVPLTTPLIAHVVNSSLEFVDADIIHIVRVINGQTVGEALSSEETSEPEESGTKAPFEDFIRSYLRSLFIANGLEDVTNAEIQRFQQHLVTTQGSQYRFGGYSGIPKDQLNEAAMRTAYESGALRFSADSQGMAAVRAYREEILKQRKND